MTGSSLPNISPLSAPDNRVPPPWEFDGPALTAFATSHWQSHVARRDDPAQTPIAVTLRFLSQDDLPDLIALHHAILAKLPDPTIFRADRPEFMADHIARRGATVGAFVDGQLIGYAVVSFPMHDPDNLARFTNLSDSDAMRVSHFDGAAVHPDFRGNHLHQTMNNIRGHYALLAGYHHIMGTVSPLNPYSLGNHLGAGFQVIGHAICYGDMPRYIIYRNGYPTTHQRLIAPDQPEHCLPVSAFDQAKDILAQGYIGYAVERTQSRQYLLHFARPNNVTADHDQVFDA
ncbi:hypothetical protein LPB41_01615 [Thalassospira sp. MA62]|nr:hypothetical protein [Thalassospira sp. MA62]